MDLLNLDAFGSSASKIGYLTVVFETIPRFPQLFVLRDSHQQIQILIAKVVEEHLIAGDKEEVSKFSSAFSTRFENGRFVEKTPLAFHRRYISQETDVSISVSMSEYFPKINPTELLRARKKENEESCTLLE